MLKVALVGNGPTAAEHAAEIDASDLVVRCNAWVPGFAGRKVDMWCSHFGDGVLLSAIKNGSLLASMGARKLMTVPRGYSKFFRCDCDPDANFLALGGNEDDFLATEAWHELTARLGGARPSTGLGALAMILPSLPGTNRISLYGFDATKPTEPGWSSPCRQWLTNDPATNPHDFVAEKALIADAIRGRHFLLWGLDVQGVSLTTI